MRACERLRLTPRGLALVAFGTKPNPCPLELLRALTELRLTAVLPCASIGIGIGLAGRGRPLSPTSLLQDSTPAASPSPQC